MEHPFTNDLIHESSLYLLSHAHNPVNWNSWSNGMLERAKKENKPILVSIGYAACHWCHVMERESFENEEVAAYMNKHFINIKIDREERPDLDHIYMEAVQVLTGSGGWPLNVFLTPDGRPFFGGTYFPPVKAFNRASWMDVLQYIADLWENQNPELEKQADMLLDHIANGGARGRSLTIPSGETADSFFSRATCSLIAENMLKSADTVNGGFGTAPKFPQTFSIQYLLCCGYYFKDPLALGHAELSLQQMVSGGIYDQLAGGLSRYSTDEKWLAPHFEKMLYDNALLVSALCDAYQVSGRKIYKAAIDSTLSFLEIEMKDKAGGYYAALDADSEGVEGKYYVWDKAEIDAVLNNDSALFCTCYGVTAKGNWEGKNILSLAKPFEVLALAAGLSEIQLEQKLDACKKSLLGERSKRIRPLTDDKILLGWNALLVTALCKAAAALDNDEYKQRAVELYYFIESCFSKSGVISFHTYKNGKATHPAFLEDHAYLIQACIKLHEITANPDFLLKAQQFTAYVIDHFEDEQTGLFYFTHAGQSDIVVRKAEIYDGATASGNSIMAENLLYLSIIFDNKEWGEKAGRLLLGHSKLLVAYPNSFGVWAMMVLKQVLIVKEIIITGKNYEKIHRQILQEYMPEKILQVSAIQADFPLLKGKVFAEKPLIYICKSQSCYPPVETIGEAKKQLQIGGE